MKIMIKRWGIPTGVAVGVLMLMIQIYQAFQLLSEDQAPILLIQGTLIRSQTDEVKELLWESIEFKLQDVFNPMQFVYSAIPYYKSKSITLGIYQDELAGYFNVPEKEDLITLEPENIYAPKLPINKKQQIDLELFKDYDYLTQNIFFAHKDIPLGEDLLGMWDFEELAQRDLTIDTTIPGPKVLIFHTHVKEEYPATEDQESITVADAGAEIKKILEEEYDLETLHITDDFYPSLESADNTGNYERMEVVIGQIIDEYPSIQIVIDLHRDGVKEGTHLVGDVNGKQTAKIMIANGLCMIRNANGDIVPMQYLQNPYVEDNLAFSIQSQILGMEYYPEMMRKIYLMPYRYSTHMVPYSILLELGAQTNTPEEIMNAIEPMTHMIGKVFQKD